MHMYILNHNMQSMYNILENEKEVLTTWSWLQVGCNAQGPTFVESRAQSCETNNLCQQHRMTILVHHYCKPVPCWPVVQHAGGAKLWHAHVIPGYIIDHVCMPKITSGNNVATNLSRCSMQVQPTDGTFFLYSQSQTYCGALDIALKTITLHHHQ